MLFSIVAAQKHPTPGTDFSNQIFPAADQVTGSETVLLPEAAVLKFPGFQVFQRLRHFLYFSSILILLLLC